MGVSSRNPFWGGDFVDGSIVSTHRAAGGTSIRRHIGNRGVKSMQGAATRDPVRSPVGKAAVKPLLPDRACGSPSQSRAFRPSLVQIFRLPRSKLAQRYIAFSQGWEPARKKGWVCLRHANLVVSYVNN